MKTEEQAIAEMTEWFAVDEHWIKGTYVRVDVVAGADVLRTCLMGQARVVAWGGAYTLRVSAEERAPASTLLGKIRNRLAAVILEQFPDRTGGVDGDEVICFNDNPDTTIEDVRLVMEKTLADVRGEAGGGDA